MAHNPFADPGDPALIVAYEGGKVVAHYGIVPGLLKSPEGNSKMFWCIAVAAEQRGRGLGRELIAVFEGRARDSGFALASLHVARDNAGAIALYEALGYRNHAPDSDSYAP